MMLLALWLGWICAGFSASGKRPVLEAVQLAEVRQALHQAYPALPDAPVAILLPRCACGDTTASVPWQQLEQAMQLHGGRALALPSIRHVPFELMLLDRRGQLVYAGPLQPSLALCGQLQANPGQWLPGLLDASQPPLYLPPSCPCGLPS
jgi:hypothetical protein